MNTKNKFVLFHPESSSYMYAHSEDEKEVLCADGEVLDVTGNRDHEDNAALQLGPWRADANEVTDTNLVLSSGSIETTEGTLIITNDAMVEIPAHIYEKYADEIDQLEGEGGGPGNINPISGV